MINSHTSISCEGKNVNLFNYNMLPFGTEFFKVCLSHNFCSISLHSFCETRREMLLYKLLTWYRRTET